MDVKISIIDDFNNSRKHWKQFYSPSLMSIFMFMATVTINIYTISKL